MTSVLSRPVADELFLDFAGSAPGPDRERVRARLIELHLPLARSLARRYTGRSEAFDDLMQVASLGLIKAVDRFDPERGLQFSTYAVPTILGELRRHFRDRTWSVHVARRQQEMSAAVSESRARLTQSLGRSPTTAQLAADLSVSEEAVLDALEVATAYAAQSLQAPVEEGITLADTLGATDGALDDVELHEAITPLLSRLPARERRILQLRFYGNWTQSAIAAELGISQMHVSRLLARTLASLRNQLLDAEVS